jgi:hypothetical protein
MTSQQFLVCDNSNATNFKSWASALSNFIRSAGWTNSTDTGQLNGAGAGNWVAVSTVPGSGAFYYEIFQPGDGLQNFYLKIEYGNSSGSSNSPTVAITLGSATNGAGGLTGFVNTRFVCSFSYAAPSTTTTYECDFSGDAGRLSILLWRTAGNNAPQVFAVQRSLNASGSPTSTYVTQWTGGYQGAGSPGWNGAQQSLHLTAGPAFMFPNRGISSGSSANTGWPCTVMNYGQTGNSSFNGSIPCAFIQPSVGYLDYPCTVLGAIYNATEGVPFTVTNQYGQTNTYIPTAAGQLGFCVAGQVGTPIVVEYD